MMSDHSNTPKTILITGASGQLGLEFQHLTEQYASFNFVFAAHEELDITNQKNLEELISRNKPAIVINCAAYTNVELAETDSEIAFLVNRLGPELLAEICREKNILLIHISTDYVFDGLSNVPYKETDSPHPINIYGQSKLEGERAIAASGCAYLIVRTSWLYSVFGKNFLLTMKRLAREKKEISVVADQYASPTYASDLAKDLLKVLSSFSAEEIITRTGIYHYTQEGICSWYEFAKEILKNEGTTIHPVMSEAFPTKARRPKFSKLDTTRWQQTFSLQPRNWKESLQECLSTFERMNQTSE